ncbi:MAG: hypothetical protein LBL69_06460 [Zoogloeaceae bacterium]|jgi:hypothetical protein|nr:hypothetical protein [Zoogloeaceae bacterium]
MTINLFSWLFPDAPATDALDDPALEKSLEYAYAAIDPRLKALGGDSRLRFREAVIHALAFCRIALDKISPILDASQANWRKSPQLRALFSSDADLQKNLSCAPALQEFVEKNPDTPFIYVVLGTRMAIVDTFGTALVEGHVQRDTAVRQLDFSSPRLFLPCDTQVAFDELCIRGLFSQLCREVRQIVDQRRDHLAELQAEIATLKNALLLRQHVGDAQDSDPAAVLRIEQDLEDRQTRLHTLRLPNLDEEMAVIAGPLAKPEVLMPIDEKSVRIDATNRLVADDAPGTTVRFHEFGVHAPEEKRGVILRLCVPAAELLSRQTLTDNLARLYP